MIKAFQDIKYQKLIVKNYRFRFTRYFFFLKNPGYNLKITTV